MIAIIYLIILFSIFFIRPVPANTVVIIDRNTHYLKTKKAGLYFFNPFTDKVTTTISTNKIYKNYTNYFETLDEAIVKVSFIVAYHSEDLTNLINSLASARRSIDDILNSSLYWAINDLSVKDFLYDKRTLEKEGYTKLASDIRDFDLSIDTYAITSITEVPKNMGVQPFKPHLNSHSAGPIRFK